VWNKKLLAVCFLQNIMPEPVNRLEASVLFCALYYTLYGRPLSRYKGGATRMATVSMATSLLGVIWPLMGLAYSAYCTKYVQLMDICTFYVGILIVYPGNRFSWERSAANASAAEDEAPRPHWTTLGADTRSLSWCMAIALFKVCRRP